MSFAVGLFCIQCRRKFSVRLLERLLADDNAYRRQLMPPGTIGKVNGRKRSDTDHWRDAVEATIALAGWAKREMRRERNRRRRKNIQCGGREGPDNNIVHRIETIRWVDMRIQFAGEDDNDCSSNECYSLSSSSDSGKHWSGQPGDNYANDNIDNEDDGFTQRLIGKGPCCVELELGKLMKELLWKDSLFGQEREDKEYVKRVIEEDIETLRAQEDQERENEICIKRILEEEEEEERWWESEART